MGGVPDGAASEENVRMSAKKLELWRLASELSVEDASILIAGGDPSETEQLIDTAVGEPFVSKITSGHDGFDAVFSALTSAIKSYELPAKIAFRVSLDKSRIYPPDEPCWLISNKALGDALKMDDYPFPSMMAGAEVYVSREPDWLRTMIRVTDVKEWLVAKDFTECIFFAGSKEASSNAFLDPDHEHFAAELAIAVTAC